FGNRDGERRAIDICVDSGGCAGGAVHLHVPECEWKDYGGAGARAVCGAYCESETFSYGGFATSAGAGTRRDEGGARGGRTRDFRSRCGAELFCESEAGERIGVDGVAETGGCAEAVQSSGEGNHRRNGLRKNGSEIVGDGAEDGG